MQKWCHGSAVKLYNMIIFHDKKYANTRVKSGKYIKDNHKGENGC